MRGSGPVTLPLAPRKIIVLDFIQIHRVPLIKLGSMLPTTQWYGPVEMTGVM